MSLFSSADRSWENFAEGRRQFGGDTWPYIMSVANGKMLWRPPGSPVIAGTETQTAVTIGLRFRCTGRLQKDSEDGIWMEVEPVWTPPPCPSFLMERNWVM